MTKSGIQKKEKKTKVYAVRRHNGSLLHSNGALHLVQSPLAGRHYRHILLCSKQLLQTMIQEKSILASL